MNPMFVFSEWCVGCVCPRKAIGDVGVGRAGHDSAPCANGETVSREARFHSRLELAGLHGLLQRGIRGSFF